MIIDLNLTELNHAKEHWTLPGENLPVGLILYSRTNAAIARYALDGLPNKVLAPEYHTVLPDEQLLADELAKTRREWERHTIPPCRTAGAPAVERPNRRGHCFLTDRSRHVRQLASRHSGSRASK